MQVLNPFISTVLFISFDLCNLGSMFNILCQSLFRKSCSLFAEIDLYLSGKLLTVLSNSKWFVTIKIIIKCCIWEMPIEHVPITLWCHYYNYRITDPLAAVLIIILLVLIFSSSDAKSFFLYSLNYLSIYVYWSGCVLFVSLCFLNLGVHLVEGYLTKPFLQKRRLVNL